MSAANEPCQTMDSSEKEDLGTLGDTDTFDGFTTHDLISALHSVCVVIDAAIVDNAKFEDHEDTMCGLAQAAKLMSAMLNKAVHS